MNCSRGLIEAYLDEELDLATRTEVEAHLATCPECSQTWSRMREQQEAIRSQAPYYKAPAPLQQSIREALRKAAAEETGEEVRTTGGDSRWRWLAIAASILLAVSLGWNFTHLASPAPGREILAENVLSSHVRSLIGEHLLDVPSTDQHTVKPWFNGKLDFSPEVKDFAPQGFPLIGGRIDYLSGRTVAALVYQRRKHVINLFTWPSGGSEVKQETFSRNGYNELAWSKNGMTFWAVSDLGIAELRQFKELCNGV